jgi:hypothetical protein
VLVLVTLGIWAWWHVPSRPLILAASPAEFVGEGKQTLPIAGTYALVRSRGQDAAVEITLPVEGAAARQIRVLPSVFADHAGYRASLEHVEGSGGKTVIGEIGGLVAADDRFVTLYLDSSRLAAGEYEITLVGVDAESPATNADRFTLRMK